MRLTDEQVESFRTAYRADFGKDISADEAREMGTRLMMFFLRVEKLMRRADTKAGKRLWT